VLLKLVEGKRDRKAIGEVERVGGVGDGRRVVMQVVGRYCVDN
jgi:hypothetical protein